jgi:alkylation response protein AidB-like acyl-CoA dehydrogenase
MELALSEEQRALSDSLRRYLRNGSAAVGGEEPDPQDIGARRAAWDALRNDGWASLDGYEADGSETGSAAATLTDQLVAHLEFGRALTIAPVVEAEVGAALIRDLGLAPTALTGTDDLVIPVLGDGQDASEFAAARTRVGLLVSGRQILVPYAAMADWLLVPVSVDDVPAAGVAVIDARDPGITVEPHSTIANIPLAALTLDSVPVAGDHVLGTDGSARAAISAACDRAALLRGAQIVGSGQRLLELSVEYALQRRQFGQPVGKFQAVQYLCTDIVIATHEALLLLIHASKTFGTGPEATVSVALARLYLGDAAHRIALAAHEVHAGFGFMTESEVPRHSRRLKYLEMAMRGSSVVAGVLGLESPAAR